MNVSIQTFQVDITPPLGAYLCLGLNAQCTGIESAIYLRGAILSEQDRSYVLVAADLSLLCGRSHYELRSCIAEVLSIAVEQVIVQTVHQHDVPGVDEDVHAVLSGVGLHMHDANYLQRVLEETAAASLRAYQERGRVVSTMRIGEAAVQDYASNRRIYHDGVLQTRFSKCQDPELKALPLGNIDPLLRQTAFYDDEDNLILTLNTYATHPQVADRRGLISGDAPGYALQRLQEEFPDAQHMYFTGCAANITNGKFAGPNSTDDIQRFGDKLFAAMCSSLEQAKPVALDTVQFVSSQCMLPLREGRASDQELREQLQNEEGSVLSRYLAAKRIYMQDNDLRSYPFSVSRLSLGIVHWYFLPAEMFLEYQQYISHLHGDESVLVAAYGDAFLAYVPTAEAFEHGGYEITFSYVERDCEQRIRQLLDDMI